ncbi:pyruvate kinase [Pseudoscourfieldia marina]
MDYIAVSFVQTGDDVQLVRKTLDTAPTPGTNTQIICKIENEEGMINFDDILKYTDGIMVARGDLGMEIPPEKTPLAQKLLITKSNIAGKFVICATQMLESMIENPLPTRAEMTDVANAVYDGADATMLSGETANGAFPVKAVATMAAIAMNAEASTNSFQTYDLIRDFTPKPMGTLEASVSGAVKASLDIGAGCLVVFTESGAACGVLSKYRPYVPIVVVTTSQAVVAKSNSRYAQYAQKVDSFPALGADADALITTVLATASAQGLYSSDAPAVVVTGIKELSADSIGRVRTVNTGGKSVISPAMSGSKTVSFRSTHISLEDVIHPIPKPRKTKILCTLGPKCWDEESLKGLLDAGMGIARFNFSHGAHEAHQEVLDRYRKVLAETGSSAAALLDTKGPEIRTAMLRDGADIYLEAGQEITIFAAGDEYTTFEGYKDDTGTVIGCSYAKLAQSVHPGNRMLFADGKIVIEVVEIIDEKNVKGKVLNDGKLDGARTATCRYQGGHSRADGEGYRRRANLREKRMDYIAVSFVQTGDDVQLVRKTLDTAPTPGTNTQIICKIENEEGMINFDDILEYTDGIMVARGDLGMEIPSEKVPLAREVDYEEQHRRQVCDRATRCSSQCATIHFRLVRR